MIMKTKAFKFMYWGETRCESPNPLTPKSDQHLIFPHNITPKSNIKVMRIKEMITN